MKISGIEITPPEPVIVVIPRGDQKIVITACPVLDYDDFDKLCPTPKPPWVRERNKDPYENPEDPEYKKQVDAWSIKRAAWSFLKSIEDSGIEWETVKMGDPETWENYETELSSCGFTIIEKLSIMQAVAEATGLTRDKIDRATEAFLVEKQEANEK